MCPSCRRLANCIMPIVPPISPTTTAAPTSENATESSMEVQPSDSTLHTHDSLEHLLQTTSTTTTSSRCTLPVPTPILQAQPIPEPPPRIEPMCSPAPLPSLTNVYTAPNCLESIRTFATKVSFARSALAMATNLTYSASHLQSALWQLVRAPRLCCLRSVCRLRDARALTLLLDRS